MLNEQKPSASVPNKFALNGVEADSEVIRVIKLDDIWFGDFRHFESKENSVFFEDFGVKMVEDSETFFSGMKLGEVVFFEVLLDVGEVLSKLF